VSLITLVISEKGKVGVVEMVPFDAGHDWLRASLKLSIRLGASCLGF